MSTVYAKSEVSSHVKESEEPPSIPTHGTSLILPELLAPAGDWECAKAAVENGADAIYFGLEKFNARMRAHNFTEVDLPKLMEFLHRRGVKGYVTFNTLVFENELEQAKQYARAIIAAGVDAAIVQDVGICRLIRQLSPDFPIHASTQMTITSVGGVEFARELGCNLVVLARECSLKEIEKIVAGGSAGSGSGDLGKGQDEQAKIQADSGIERGLLTSSPTISKQDRPKLPLEVFVHGALCVAYSGQCLTSESLGGRSANRGECAQACRMPYELISDGKIVELGNRKYLLSPQDLAGLTVLEDLVRAGVASLKIEGRLKSPEYVANITRLYRKALDAFAGAENCQRNSRPNLKETSRTAQYEMEMAFSRGLYTGWFRGVNNQELVHASFGKKRGVYLGQVLEVRPDSVLVELEQAVEPGDGVVFDAGKPEEQEEGGRVYEVLVKKTTRAKSSAVLRFGRDDIQFSRIHAGNKLWKTSDPKLERDLRRTFEGEQPKFQRPVSMEVHGQVGTPLTLIVRDEIGHVATIDSSMPLAKAETCPLDSDRLKQQLGRLGGTAFYLASLKNSLQDAVVLPVSELNRLRREAVHQLETQRSRPLRWTLKAPAGEETVWAKENSFKAESEPVCSSKQPELIVLVRTLAQLEEALKREVATIYCEFEDPKKYRDAVALYRNGGSKTKGGIFVAPPRVFKMGEDWTLRQVRSSEADGYLIRNYDHLRFFEKDRRIGDYSLNVANSLSAIYFKSSKFGLERVTASYDLNFGQLEALLHASPPEWFEVTLHQHMPMFHMEHCVFCAFLSNGTDYTNCGRPCDHHQVQLRDRVGAEHPIKADAGCRNTVFNARAQTGAEYAARMIQLGVRHFRIEFLNEPPGIVGETIEKYRQLLAGKISGAQLWSELKLVNQLGVTRGQMAGTRERF